MVDIMYLGLWKDVHPDLPEKTALAIGRLKSVESEQKWPVKSVKELKGVSVATESATNACEGKSDKCSANDEK